MWKKNQYKKLPAEDKQKLAESHNFFAKKTAS